MNSRALIREIESAGWVRVGVKGSHHKFKHPGRAGIVIVPHPKKDLPQGTVQAIRRQAGLK